MSTPVDPITLELIKGMMRSARAEMEALIERTAMSPFIREKKDYFTAFFDRQGRLLYGTNLPLGGNILDCVLQAYPPETMRPDDLYWYNDCYGSGGGVSHSPDMVFVAPVFHQGQLTGFAQAWGHLWDIGGMMPGSISPAATEVYQEGIIMPPIRIYRDGVLNDEVWRIFARNSRFPDILKGDLLRLMTPGGGGWGDPLERDPARVQDDVLDGFVSRHSALVDYGVVLDPYSLEVDEAATRQRRRQTQRQTAMFHRGTAVTA